MLNFVDTGMVLSFIFNSIMKSCMGVFSQSFGKYPVKDLKNGRRNWENKGCGKTRHCLLETALSLPIILLLQICV